MTDPNGGTIEANFYYNFSGLPDSIVKGPYGEYPFYTVYPYEYDESGRLIQTGAYTTESPSKVTYAYEGNSRLPARDTLHSFNTTVQYVEYDANGRIVRVYSKNITSDGEIYIPDTDVRYYYDMRGNRQEHPSNDNYPGIIKYSDKPSIYSLNNVWQLEYKNYSKNSLLIGVDYNEHGLPLTLKENLGRNHPFYHIGDFTRFIYECK